MSEQSSYVHELDYKVQAVNHPSYQMSQVVPQAGSASVVVTSAGGQESIFEIPPKVFNSSRSVLSFTATPAAGTAFNWMHANGLLCFREVHMYTRTGTVLCDINNFNFYSNATIRHETKSKDMLHYDQGTDGSGYFEGLRSSGTATLTSATARRPDNTAPYQPVLEATYAISGGSATATPVVKFQVPLERIKNSVLSIDKDQFFGDTVYLRLVWAPSTSFVWNCGSATNPTAATIAAAGNVTMSSIMLYLAIEQNPVINQALMEKARSGTLSYQVPYVHTNFVSLAQGTTHNLAVRYNRAHGKKLKKIIWAPFGTGTNNLLYNRDALASAGVITYYSMVNNIRQQQYNLDTTLGNDWMERKRDLVGSCINTSNEFYYNFTHYDDFSYRQKVGDQLVDDSTLDDGLDLSTELKYDIASTTANIAINHYVFAVCTKDLTVSPAGVNLI